MPEPLPEPPADRSAAWRSPPPPPNPDLAVASPGRRLRAGSLLRLMPLAALAAVALGFVAGSGGPLAGLAEVAMTLIVLGVIAAIVLWGAMSLLAEFRKDRERHRATERIRAWAGERSLEFKDASDLPEATPLLAKGTTREARNICSGELPGGLPGVLAHYTYVVHRDEGEYEAYPHTLVVARVPETLGFASGLALASRRRGIRNRIVDRTLGALARSLRRRRRVRLESAKLERRFEIWAPDSVDENWVRQLFTPVFVDWLAEHSPADFLFELREGVVCVGVAREVTDTAYLDGLCQVACYVAGRLREEALEVAGLAGAGGEGRAPVAAPALAPVAGADWSGPPPPDVATASRSFRLAAARDPGTWLWPLAFGALGLLGGLLIVGWLISGDASVESAPLPEGGALIAGLALGALLGGWWLMREARRGIRDRAEAYGEEAFLRAYAHARGLVFEQPQSFHASHVNASLPGPARFVVSGPLAGAPAGSLVVGINGDGSGGEYLALVAPLGDRRGPTVRIEPGARPPESGLAALPAPVRGAIGSDGALAGLGVGLEGGAIAVYRDCSGRSLSVSQLDGFAERVGAVLGQVVSPAVAPAHPVGSSASEG